MDIETGNASTASASRYADRASAGEESGVDGSSRPPPTANRRTKSGAKKTRWRVLTTSDGLSSLTVARVLDVGGPQTSSPTSTKASEAAAGRPMADNSNSAPSARKHGGATGATEADKHLQFLMGLIPGAQKPGNLEENPALVAPAGNVVPKYRTTRPQSAQPLAPPTVHHECAPSRRRLRRGPRPLLRPTKSGFRKPTRKHTARTVVLAAAAAAAAAADGATTANRYNCLPDATAEATDAEQQKRAPPPPPVVI
ncbi:uncharacterized protein LOC124545578 [Schistocerca americana]|uniref:uncharacterized protein LOC124545578 n=1 Tax=Schistocerca americana TaxID=7009 RepID=UPI001F4F4DD7|nr:uncharacterized protein LOC124545578 [Schistocerca americana]